MNYNQDNILLDFAQRTKKNLTYIESQVQSSPDKDLFEVTQLINSLLGLLVFPFEKDKHRIPNRTLQELQDTGWKVPRIIGNFKQVSNLRQLIRYLRNSVAHFNIEFYSDEKNQIAGLRVWNVHENRGITWKAEMSIDELRNNVYKFIEIIEDTYATPNN